MQHVTCDISSLIANRFNRAVKTYDEVSTVQHEAGSVLLAKVKNCSHYFSDIIDLGCGSGFTTKKIAEQLRYQRFDAIDIAENFIEGAKDRLGLFNINCFNINFDEIYPQTKYSLIFSNFALHWSKNFQFTIKNINRHLKNNGIFAMTIPLLGTFDTVPNKHRNTFLSIEQVLHDLQSAGLNNIESSMMLYTVTYPDVIVGLKAIKAMGADYLFSNQWADNQLFSLRPRKNVSNPFLLNYQIGFFIAKNTHNINKII